MSGYVMLVEDDARLQKVFEIILHSGGYRVCTASGADQARDLLRVQGLPDALVLDLILPREDPFELVRELRKLPRGEEVAVLAVSSSLSKLQEARATSLGIAEFLVKPIDKVTLLESMQRHLPSPAAAPAGPANKRVLVVDDNAMQVKLARLRLTAAGFEVATAGDGLEALGMARAIRPDAVVSDVIMPRMDGFQLCHALRQDPELSDLVVILVSASYVDEPIRLMGSQAGADEFVTRTPDMMTVVASLRAHLHSPRVRPRSPEVPEGYVPTLFNQLERQVMLTQGLSRRCAQLGTSLSLLASLSTSLTQTPDVEAGAQAMLEQLVADRRFAAAGLRLLPQKEWLQRPSEPLLRLPRELEELCLTTRETQTIRRDAGRLTVTPVLADDEVIALLALAEDEANEADDSASFARVLAAQLAQGLVMARVLADQAEVHERFGQLARHIDEVFWLSTADVSEILFASQAYERIWGRSVEALKQRPHDFVEAIHPEDLPNFLADMLKLQRGEEITQEFRIVQPDGSVRQIGQRCFPIRNERGDVYRLCGVGRDVTEQRLLERQFQQAQKMEALGRLAGGVAHDFNNLLTVITGFGELVLSELPADHPQSDSLKEVLKAGERAALLTRQLLTFSRRDVVQPVTVNLNDTLQEIHSMLRRVIGEDLRLNLQLCAEPATISIDRGQLEQVVMNLAVNARDAMPGGGQLTLETSLEDREARRYVRLAVSDNGHGMDEKTRQRIFEPFFSTKGTAGTGLGLATVFGIVRGAGGLVEVYSEVGLGATFKVYLPYQGSCPPTPLAPAAEALPQGSETILLVEDDEAVRRLTRLALGKLGYRVLEARCEGEALAHCGSHDGPIHLLLSDVVMPDASGPELAQRLASQRREMKVLFMSGYTDETIFRYGILEKGLAYMEKPFTPARLAGKVREVLES